MQTNSDTEANTKPEPNIENGGQLEKPDELVQKALAPFTIYDIFGYLAPGATLLFSIAIFEAFLKSTANSVHTPLRTAFVLLVPADPAKQLLQTTLITLALISASYIAGHIISSLSSFLLDRTLVYKGYGYPYANLLQVSGDLMNVKARSGFYYRGLFFWVNFYLLSRFLSFVGKPILVEVWSNVALRSAQVAEVVIIVGIAAKLLVGSKAGRLFIEKKASRLKGVEVCFKVFASPYDLTTKSIAHILNTRRAFDDTFVALYKRLFKQRFGLDVEQANTNNFWFSYCYVVQKSPQFGTMLTNWLSIYSFSRNLATSFYCAFLYCFVSLMKQDRILARTSMYERQVLVALPIALLLISFILLARYYYVFTCYFTKFLFRAFVFLAPDLPNQVTLLNKGPNP